MEKVSLAILCGGQSNRFHSYKSLALFHRKPLITHMVGIAKKISDSVFIVVSDSKQKEQIKPLVGEVPIVLDPEDYPDCPLSAALAAFTTCEEEFCQLFPVDTPLLKPSLVECILRFRNGQDAVVPHWPSGYIEPLHSVYRTAPAASKAKNLLDNQSLKMRNLVDGLENVLFVSVKMLKRIDPELDSFKNANTREELLELERM